MPLILALDLSTRTGWALGRDYESPIHGVWVLPRMSDLGACLSALAGQLEDAIQVFHPDLVIMEAPLPPQAQTAASTARLLLGLAGVTEMICQEQGVPCEEERADTVRKVVMGSARQDKAAIIAWCRAQTWRPAEDNDADALVLLRYRQILSRSRVTAGRGSAAA